MFIFYPYRLKAALGNFIHGIHPLGLKAILNEL